MNYQRIYASIVLRAQSEYNERIDNKKLNGAYYEMHHILPKSLGGTNEKYNLAMLTAREHFICHWLLVKLYPKNSMPRRKMLIALWRMGSASRTNHDKRYINSHVYESLRTEFANAMGTITSKCQSGTGNSQYGAHWYTNAHDGMVTLTTTALDYPWCRGKNLFKGEFNHLAFVPSGKSVPRKRMLWPSMKGRQLTVNSIEEARRKLTDEAIVETRKLWNEFHNGSYTSLGEWGRTHNLSYQAIRKRFKRFIPIFNELCEHGVAFRSLPTLVGVYNRPEA